MRAIYSEYNLQDIKPKALYNFKGQVIKGQLLTVKVLFKGFMFTVTIWVRGL